MRVVNSIFKPGIAAIVAATLSYSVTPAAGWAFVIAFGDLIIATVFVTCHIKRAQKARLRARASGDSPR
jgi:uncharacterized membrane protein